MNPLTLDEARGLGINQASHNYQVGAVVRVNAGRNCGALHRVVAVDGDMLTVKCITVLGAKEFVAHYVDLEAV